MKRKEIKTLQGLGDLLPQMSQRCGWKEQLDMHSLFLRWEKLLASEITKHCRPLKIVRKVLWAEVENSAWLQQYQFQSQFILETLNNSLCRTKLKGIRFCVAEKEFEEKKKEPPLRYVQPSAEELAKFEQQISIISDDNSREALLRFWYLSKACQRG